MPDNRRAPALAYVLAVPVLIAVYVATFGARAWAALRPAVAALLGATVIGAVYTDAALRKAPATPMRAAVALALAVALVGPGMAPAPTSAAGNPADNVIAAARQYLGVPYKLGAEGPRQFDCSGLTFRAFSDAGELPRIGGMRLLARGYLRWFVSRGLFTKDEDSAERGDLVVWNDGEHIGIYLGDGKAISALVNPYGVTIHGLNWIGQKVTQFLRVEWRSGDDDPGDDPGPGDGGDPGDGGTGPGNGGDDPGNGPGNGGDPDPGDGGNPDPGDGGNPDPGDGGNPDPGDGGNPNPGDGPGNGGEPDPGQGPPGKEPPADSGNGDAGNDVGTGNGDIGRTANEYGPLPEQAEAPRQDPENAGADQPSGGEPGNQPSGRDAYAAGTLNMRASADPESRIVGWVSRGTTFKILNSGTSPGGWMWYEIKTISGKTGWVWSYWVRAV